MIFAYDGAPFSLPVVEPTIISDGTGVCCGLVIEVGCCCWKK